MTHAHPKGFIDLLADDPVTGRAYMCYGCAVTVTHLIKGLTQPEADLLAEKIGELHAEVKRLEDELKAEKERTITSEDAKNALLDLRELLKADV